MLIFLPNVPMYHVSPICYPATCIRRLSHLIYRMSKNFQASNDPSHGNNPFPETLNNLQKQWFCKWLSHICVHLGCLSVSYFWDGSISALSKNKGTSNSHGFLWFRHTPFHFTGATEPQPLHQAKLRGGTEGQELLTLKWPTFQIIPMDTFKNGGI